MSSWLRGELLTKPWVRADLCRVDPHTFLCSEDGARPHQSLPSLLPLTRRCQLLPPLPLPTGAPQLQVHIAAQPARHSCATTAPSARACSLAMAQHTCVQAPSSPELVSPAALFTRQPRAPRRLQPAPPPTQLQCYRHRDFLSRAPAGAWDPEPSTTSHSSHPAFPADRQ